jgi:hypothetical protein
MPIEKIRGRECKGLIHRSRGTPQERGAAQFYVDHLQCLVTTDCRDGLQSEGLKTSLPILTHCNSTLDIRPSSLRHRIGGTIEAELLKTLAVCC